MEESYRVTGVGETPGEERSHRMRNYLIAMGVRMACIVALPFVRGWVWILLLAIGAVFLPYFAVVLANAKGSVQGGAPEPVNPLELAAPPSASPETDPDSAEPLLLVFDADGNEEVPPGAPGTHGAPGSAGATGPSGQR